MSSVFVSVTRCIVSSPPPVPAGRASLGAGARALVVPANEQLVGTQFAYFPQVETTKEVGAQPNWGGADLVAGMFYPVQVIDGVVGQMGGKALREVCADLPVVGSDDVRCPVGQAVATIAPGRLGDIFDMLIHAVPPLWPRRGTKSSAKDIRDAERLLADSYLSAFKYASEMPPRSVLLCPLLGCGARGAPVNVSIASAVESLRRVDFDLKTNNVSVQFGLQDPTLAKTLRVELVKAGLPAT